MSTTNFQRLIALLSQAEVEYVIIGGLAAAVHGSAYVTYDVDVCYQRSPANGALDLFGEVGPLGEFSAVAKHSEVADLFGFRVRVLSLEALIRAKRAAGRGKDLPVIPELEALLELRKRAHE